MTPTDELIAAPPPCNCGAVDAYDHSRECVEVFDLWKVKYREGLKESLARAEARANEAEAALSAERDQNKRLVEALTNAQRCFRRLPPHQSDYDKAEAIIDAALAQPEEQR
jgi:hypothetical protein